VIRPGVAALIDAVNPDRPATYAPLVAHCAACYADECCPLCDGPLSPPPAVLAELTVGGVLGGAVTPVGACQACQFAFIGPDPRDPADLTRRELIRIKATWMLAVVAVMGDDDPPGESSCDV
jgi:hypothetical protein